MRIKDDTGATVWELLEGVTLDGITVPEGVLEDGERTYTVEVRHHGTTYGASAWSTPASFSTELSFVPDFETQIGAVYGGGYVAGKIVSDYDGLTYGLIVSDGGGDSEKMGVGSLQWRHISSGVSNTDGVPPKTLADGRANHNAIVALNALTSFAAFEWIEENCNAGEGLNGHTDWYLPSRDEMELIYRNFKPTSDANNTNNRATHSSYFGADGLPVGTNSSSIPEGTGYTSSNPSQTALSQFQDDGPDALMRAQYWTSTEDYSTGAWSASMVDGFQDILDTDKVSSYRVRAVRRVLLS